MMNAYLENRPEEFKLFAAKADQETLLKFLELALDQRRKEFVQIILAELPEDWCGDELAEKLIHDHNCHSLKEVLAYTSNENHSKWLESAITNGDADIVQALYKTMPDVDANRLADAIYEMVHEAGSIFSQARHTAVFEVVRSALTKEKLAELYNQATKDKEALFIEYLNKVMA